MFWIGSMVNYENLNEKHWPIVVADEMLGKLIHSLVFKENISFHISGGLF